MPTTFSHANIVTKDPEGLARFYVDVFDCEQSGPERHLVGEWLGRGMGLAGAEVHGLHLRLPGSNSDASTLELFSVPDVEDPTLPVHTRPGLMHLAFRVDDIHATLDKLLAAGGAKLGEITEAPIAGVGTALFIYTRDPEGNIVELQQWQ
jgi:catechol 2,3-dioxygenase-like lactoylglutathione lyase family enzyme